ncbi:hypothetical protein ABMA70_01600 [Halobacteriovorax sp. XZX-3]|uniref:hypothetical protein n=1 Tax=unclassified Halobacteriovorax TaxID=2639665 RepID=UPI003716102B
MIRSLFRDMYKKKKFFFSFIGLLIFAAGASPGTFMVTQAIISERSFVANLAYIFFAVAFNLWINLSSVIFALFVLFLFCKLLERIDTSFKNTEIFHHLVFALFPCVSMGLNMYFAKKLYYVMLLSYGTILLILSYHYLTKKIEFKPIRVFLVSTIWLLIGTLLSVSSILLVAVNSVPAVKLWDYFKG